MTRDQIKEWGMTHGWTLTPRGHLVCDVRERNDIGLPVYHRYHMLFRKDRVVVSREENYMDGDWKRIEMCKLVGVNVDCDGNLRIGGLCFG